MTLRPWIGSEPVGVKAEERTFKRKIYAIPPTTASTISWKAPGGKIWRVNQCQVTYTTNAVAGNRFPFCLIRNDLHPTGDTLWGWFPVVAVNSYRYYNWMPNVAMQTYSTGYYEVTYLPFPDMIIDDELTIAFGADVSGAPGSTNTWSGKLWVQEYDVNA